MTRPQRLHPRYAHGASVALRVGTAVIPGHTMNVSQGGLCADLAHAIPLGTEVSVDLQLSLGDGWYSEPLRLPGQIVWCTKVKGGHQVGLAFRKLDADRAMYLMMFLRYLDPGWVRERAARPATVDERFC